MLSELKVTKQALSANFERDAAYCAATDVHALLELNALIDKQPDCWVAYCLRGKINATLDRYLEAISDYTQALRISKSLNCRNRRDLLQSIAFYADQLNSLQASAGNRGPLQHTCVLAKNIDLTKTGEGKLKNLGAFLFDASDIEKLVQLYRNGDDGESTMRWLTTYSF